MKLLGLITYIVILLNALQAAGSDPKCVDLKAPGYFTKAYLTKLAPDLIIAKNTSEKLQVILSAVYKKDPINVNHLNFQSFEQLTKKYGKDEIPSNTKLNLVAKEQSELYREMHNRYSRYGLSTLFFGPSAEDVIHFKMAFGCSHFARAILALVRLAKIVPDDDVKYIAAVSMPDQEKICLSNTDDTMANGHQFLLIKINDQWKYWNTSAPKLELLPALNWRSWRDQNEIIQFASLFKMPDNGRVAVRAIEENSSAPLCDNSLEKLRNIYRSGNSDDMVCHWPPRTK